MKMKTFKEINTIENGKMLNKSLEMHLRFIEYLRTLYLYFIDRTRNIDVSLILYPDDLRSYYNKSMKDLVKFLRERESYENT